MDKKSIDDYICYDGPLPECPQIDNISDEEAEREFQKRFGKYINNEE